MASPRTQPALMAANIYHSNDQHDSNARRTSGPSVQSSSAYAPTQHPHHPHPMRSNTADPSQHFLSSSMMAPRRIRTNTNDSASNWPQGGDGINERFWQDAQYPAGRGKSIMTLYQTIDCLG